MVGVAVLAIALGAGVPSMSEFIKSSRLSVQTNDLLASLHLARTEAIKRNARVTLCKSANATACSTAPGTGWEIGWMVFADTDNDGNADAGEALLDSHGAAATNVSITPRAADPDAVPPRAADTIGNFVSYTSRGAIRDAAGAAQSGVFRVCDERGLDHARGLVLSPTGRAEFTKSTSVIGACP